MKIHLVECDEPLKAGLDIYGNCGVLVQKARPAFMWDDAQMGGEFLAAAEKVRGICRKCLSDKAPSSKYVYGITAGEETA